MLGYFFMENNLQATSLPISNIIETENNNSDSLKGRTILVVNTGSAKKKFILQKLKKLGLTIVVLNREKNWAQLYVDQWILADTFNHKESLRAVEAFIKNNPQIKIDGVVTFWEDDVLLTSKIVDKFDFIGIPNNIAKKVRNKYLFRDFCHENGINAPQYTLVKDIEDLKRITNFFHFPVVIKPAYGASSAYVIKVDQPGDLENTYNYIKKNISSDTETALSDGLDILVEEYIDGDEVDIDILLQNGKIKFYTIADNFNKSKGEFFIDSGQAIPSTLPEKNQNELIEMAEEALEKLGIQNACIHFEAKSTASGAVPIEINMRMGGDYVYSYIKGAWGVDFIEHSVKIALGQFIKIKKLASPYKHIIGWDLHPDHSGILVEMNVNEEFRKRKYFEEIHFYKEVGNAVLLPPEGNESIGWLTVSGNNYLDANDNLKDALDYIKFNVVEFNQDSSLGKTSRPNRLSVAVLNKNILLKLAKFNKMKDSTFESQRNLNLGLLHNEIGEGESESKIQTFAEKLKQRGYKVSVFDMSNPVRTVTELKEAQVDLVLNFCDKIFDSDGLEPHSAALLELLQIPYIGSDSFTLALCRDKIKVKKLLNFHDIPTPKWDYFYDVNDEIRSDLKYPLIVKPGLADDSIGISNQSVVKNQEQLRQQLKKIIEELNMPAVVEEYITGDEFRVSILGNDESDLRVLPLSRSIFKNLPIDYWHIYTRSAKISDDPIYNNVIVQSPARGLDKKLESLITEIALDAYNILDCRDYGQVDVRVDSNGNPYVLELNPNPFSEQSFFAAADLVGIGEVDLLEEIINLAVKRYKHLKPFKMFYK